jgi:hypothetical protein
VDRRLTELTAAGQAGDVAAAEDSAAAYDDELQAALASNAAQDAPAMATLLEHHQQVLAQLAASAPAPARAALSRAAAAAQRAQNAVHPAKAGPAIVTGPPANAGPVEATAERDLSEDTTSPREELADGNGLGQEGAPGSDARRHHLAPPLVVRPTGDPDRPGKQASPPGKPASPPARDGSQKTTNVSDSKSKGPTPATSHGANGPKSKDLGGPKPTVTARATQRPNPLSKTRRLSRRA